MVEKIKEYVMLTQMKGLGPVSQNKLLEAVGGIINCFRMEEREILSICERKEIRKSRVNAFLSQRDDSDIIMRADRIINESYVCGINIIIKESEEYPLRFNGLEDTPILLYSKGKLLINNYGNSVGVIGARRCSAQGKEKAIRIACDASKQKKAIISGMAKGIDSYAHTAAIKTNGYTIAVLGNGADICYPKEHYRLYERIVEKGCVLSEYPPGILPKQYYFPRRNRLIAALSDDLYVIDAGRNSGTESTVKYGKTYDRHIFTY